jgi:hypothetical protein
MKYIPVNAKDRTFIDSPRWNWYFLRSVQRILRVVKGIVMPGEDFFKRAFGENQDEFMKILHMPENVLMKRGREPGSEEKNWRNKFRLLTEYEKMELLKVLCENKTRENLRKAIARNKNRKLRGILDLYILKGRENYEEHLV